MLLPIHINDMLAENFNSNFILIRTLHAYLESMPQDRKRQFSFFFELLEDLKSVNQNLEFWSKKIAPFFQAFLSNLFSLKENEIDDALFDLFLLFIDAYFIYFNPFRVILTRQIKKPIHLPNLGISLYPKDNLSSVSKTAEQLFLINDLAMTFRPMVFEVADGAKLLISNANTYECIFKAMHPSYLALIASYKEAVDLQSSLKKLRSALAAIQIASPDLYLQLVQIIKFYVPLQNIKSHSTSFSLKPYFGVVFLSFNTDIFAIAENIIREYGNNVLHACAKFKSFFANNDACYYSPYSKDLSTPQELLANVFAFVMVIKFFCDGLLNLFFEKEFNLIAYRLTVQISRLYFAFIQLKMSPLTSDGEALVKFLYHEFLALKNANNHHIVKMPEIIFDHLEAWKEKYVSELPNFYFPQSKEFHLMGESLWT